MQHYPSRVGNTVKMIHADDRWYWIESADLLTYVICNTAIDGYDNLGRGPVGYGTHQYPSFAKVGGNLCLWWSEWQGNSVFSDLCGNEIKNPEGKQPHTNRSGHPDWWDNEERRENNRWYHRCRGYVIEGVETVSDKKNQTALKRLDYDDVHVVMTGSEAIRMAPVVMGPAHAATITTMKGIKKNHIVIYKRGAGYRVMKLSAKDNPIEVQMATDGLTAAARCSGGIYIFDVDAGE